MGKKETAEPQPLQRQLPVGFVVCVAQKENNSSKIFQRQKTVLLPYVVVLECLAINKLIYYQLCDNIMQFNWYCTFCICSGHMISGTKKKGEEKNQSSPYKPQEKKVPVSTSWCKKVVYRKLWEIHVLKIIQNFSVLMNQVPKEKIKVVIMPGNDSYLPPTSTQLKLGSCTYWLFKGLYTTAAPLLRTLQTIAQYTGNRVFQ